MIYIRINPLGNVGNRMLQYLAAYNLSQHIRNSIISAGYLPEWQINFKEGGENIEDRYIYTIDNVDDYNIELIQRLINEGSIKVININDYLQRLEFYPSVEVARMLFPLRETANRENPDKNALVISIRAGEILDGYPHYPLPPVAFLRDIADSMSRPVVIYGQLEPSFYTELLYKNFPDATFICSKTPEEDFEYLRKSKHIVISVSTFSWLAAWLSLANTMVIPLIGFLSPALYKEIDLLPVSDSRYRFYFLPVNYGLPEQGRAMLNHHERIDSQWLQISAAQVEKIAKDSPFIAPRPDVERIAVEVNAMEYLHEYIDAAKEVGSGWFIDATDHYLQIGKARGYKPHPKNHAVVVDRDVATIGQNLSLGCIANQSSTSEWSHSADTSQDASRALRNEATGSYSCHTNLEYCPWWQVDLGEISVVREIVIYNRGDHASVADRLSPLVILASNDGISWSVVDRLNKSFIIFGSNNPLCYKLPTETLARFIRLQIGKITYLHIDKVEIIGIKR